jgi:hypothetical protein
MGIADDGRAQKQHLVRALANAHARLLAAETDALDGSWDAREILAHVAAWEAEAMRRIPLLLSGAPEITYDVDAFNARAVTGVEQQSLREARDQLERVHKDFVRLLEGLDASAFVPGGAAHEWTAAQARHSDEHATELGAPKGRGHERG